MKCMYTHTYIYTHRLLYIYIGSIIMSSMCITQLYPSIPAKYIYILLLKYVHSMMIFRVKILKKNPTKISKHIYKINSNTIL